jgi:NADH-quinone oxidoreductase subunit L
MAFFLQYAWLIPLLPLASFLIISFTPIRRNRLASGWLAIGMMLLTTLLALGLLAAVGLGLQLRAGQPVQIAAEHGAVAEVERSFTFTEPNVVQRFDWAPAGDAVFQMGIYVDPIAAVMLAMVTIASSCIHLFSLGYMATNARQARFFSFISLFTAAMLLMAMADNLLLFFMAWEIMGLASYLLIGFLYQRPQAAQASLKAFITTRIGDVLMLIGLAYLYTMAGSLAFGSEAGQIFNPEFLVALAGEQGVFDVNHATVIALLLFCGTIGKSAQFPLHVWLPDAMEGPTPVSALIHAATMVAAGVFLVGRTFPIFVADGGGALLVVAFIGTLTALGAALIAVAQFDIKRILAYSTLSQLGFMVAALGVGGWVPAMFHLITHAFFKALLFLGSGSVIHAMEAQPAIEKLHHSDEYAAQQTAQDIRNMGDLRDKLPWTFWTYTAGYLALAGIVPFAGFWSKDEILAEAFKGGHYVVFGVLAVAAFLTAFYMTRQWRMVFFGRYRGEDPIVFQNPAAVATPETQNSDIGHSAHDEPAHQSEHAAAHWHENPSMIAALVVLAAFAVTGGLLNFPLGLPFAHWLSNITGQEYLPFNVTIAGISLLIAGLGIAAGWFYGDAFKSAHDRDPLDRRAPGLFNVLNQQLLFDRMYAASFGEGARLLAQVWNWIDRTIIDRLVNGTGLFTFFLGRLNFIIDDTLLNDGPDALAGGTVAAGEEARRLQTGHAQDYLRYIFIGVVLFGLFYLYFLQAR